MKLASLGCISIVTFEDYLYTGVKEDTSELLRPGT